MAMSRRVRPEVMDQPGLARARHTAALTGLGRINLLSGTAGTLFAALAGWQRRVGLRTLRVLDVASGGGDVAVRLARRAARRGLDWRLSGCDRSEVAVEHAGAAARRAGVGVKFFACDALAGALPGDYDAVMCSLFLHHLTEEEAVRLLGAMALPPHPPPPPSPTRGEGGACRWLDMARTAGEGPDAGAPPPPQAGPPSPLVGEGAGGVGGLSPLVGEGAAAVRGGPRLVLVHDLHRHRLGLWLAHVATRLLTRSPVVHTDGPRSVEAAFTPAEALALATRAGLHGATVRRTWPFRWLLSWSAP